ncbi:unnamed protein product, partial [Mesorhabditis spiculigera]
MFPNQNGFPQNSRSQQIPTAQQQQTAAVMNILQQMQQQQQQGNQAQNMPQAQQLTELMRMAQQQGLLPANAQQQVQRLQQAAAAQSSNGSRRGMTPQMQNLDAMRARAMFNEQFNQPGTSGQQPRRSNQQMMTSQSNAHQMAQLHPAVRGAMASSAALKAQLAQRMSGMQPSTSGTQQQQQQRRQHPAMLQAQPHRRVMPPAQQQNVSLTPDQVGLVQSSKKIVHRWQREFGGSATGLKTARETLNAKKKSFFNKASAVKIYVLSEISQKFDTLMMAAEMDIQKLLEPSTLVLNQLSEKAMMAQKLEEFITYLETGNGKINLSEAQATLDRMQALYDNLENSETMLKDGLRSMNEVNDIDVEFQMHNLDFLLDAIDITNFGYRAGKRSVDLEKKPIVFVPTPPQVNRLKLWDQLDWTHLRLRDTGNLQLNRPYRDLDQAMVGALFHAFMRWYPSPHLAGDEGIDKTKPLKWENSPRKRRVEPLKDKVCKCGARFPDGPVVWKNGVGIRRQIVPSEEHETGPEEQPMEVQPQVHAAEENQQSTTINPESVEVPEQQPPPAAEQQVIDLDSSGSNHPPEQATVPPAVNGTTSEPPPPAPVENGVKPIETVVVSDDDDIEVVQVIPSKSRSTDSTETPSTSESFNQNGHSRPVPPRPNSYNQSQIRAALAKVDAANAEVNEKSQRRLENLVQQINVHKRQEEEARVRLTLESALAAASTSATPIYEEPLGFNPGSFEAILMNQHQQMNPNVETVNLDSDGEEGNGGEVQQAEGGYQAHREPPSIARMNAAAPPVSQSLYKTAVERPSMVGQPPGKLYVDMTDPRVIARATPPKRKHKPTQQHSPGAKRPPLKKRKDAVAPLPEVVTEWTVDEDGHHNMCFCCQNKKDTNADPGCCDKCPRIYHAECHIPTIRCSMADLPDDWICSWCQPAEPTTTFQDDDFTEDERLNCIKVLLGCYKRPDYASIFIEPVDLGTELDYIKLVEKPVDFSMIAAMLDPMALDQLQNVRDFINHMNAVFMNCSIYNEAKSAVMIACKAVYQDYLGSVKKFLPAYKEKVFMFVHYYRATKKHSIRWRMLLGDTLSAPFYDEHDYAPHVVTTGNISPLRVKISLPNPEKQIKREPEDYPPPQSKRSRRK